MRLLRVATTVAATAMLVMSSGCSSDTVTAQEPEQTSSHEPTPVVEQSETPSLHAVPLVGSVADTNVSGVVVLYDAAREVGFIGPDSGQRTLPFSAADVVNGDRTNIQQSQWVLFDIDSTPKGLRAVNISFINQLPRGIVPLVGSANSTKQAGTVQFFNAEKGYGFITADEGGSPVFFLASDQPDPTELRMQDEGQRVRFDVRDGSKGPIAVELTVIEGP